MTQYIIDNKWSAAAYVPALLVVLVMFRCAIGASATTTASAEYQVVGIELGQRGGETLQLQQAAEDLQREVYALALEAIPPQEVSWCGDPLVEDPSSESVYTAASAEAAASPEVPYDL